MSVQLKKDDQIREIIRCGRDPVYFIKTYTKIQHPIKGIIPFDTYSFQDDCVNAFEDNRFNIILKSRQLGLSTICAAYALWEAIFHKARNILVIATKLATAQNFTKKVRTMLQSMPRWLLLTSYEHNQREIRFDNGSTIMAIPTSEDAGRSEALTLLIVDEAAFIDNFEQIWTGLYPTISTGGRAIVLSTPRGVGGQYYKLWTNAAANLNDFNPIKLPWNVHPDHDEAWFANETKGLGTKEIAQEFLCDFLSSGDTFLQPEDLDYLRVAIRPPIDRTGFDRNIWIWERPLLGTKYVVSADVARGNASDYSAFHVIDTNTCKVVAEYKGKVPPDQLADMLADIGRQYNTALLCPENNTYGYATVMRLRDTGYPRLYYDCARGNIYDYVPLSGTETPGFSTQSKSRIQVLTKLEELLRTKRLLSFSQRLFDELQGFIWNNGKAQAQKDSHDDLILSLAIGTWLTDVVFGTSSDHGKMTQALLSANVIARRDLDTVPGAPPSPGVMSNPYMKGINPYSVYRPAISGRGSQHGNVDLSWLIK